MATLPAPFSGEPSLTSIFVSAFLNSGKAPIRETSSRTVAFFPQTLGRLHHHPSAYLIAWTVDRDEGYSKLLRRTSRLVIILGMVLYVKNAILVLHSLPGNFCGNPSRLHLLDVA